MSVPVNRVQHVNFEGYDAVELSAPRLKVIVLPRFGGKLISLRDTKNDREWLWQNPFRPLSEPAFGSPYDEWDMSGFDECLPTIAECKYPFAPWSGTALPDHGEVWATPCDYEVGEDGTLRLEVLGRTLPYKFTKRIAVSGNSLLQEYGIENLSREPLHFAWSAHPILRAEPGMKIEAPDVKTVRVDESVDGSLGMPDTEHPWPVASTTDGDKWDLSLVPESGVQRAAKVYSQPLEPGKQTSVALRCPSGESLTFRFSTDSIPFVGF